MAEARVSGSRSEDAEYCAPCPLMACCRSSSPEKALQSACVTLEPSWAVDGRDIFVSPHYLYYDETNNTPACCPGNKASGAHLMEERDFSIQKMANNLKYFAS